MESTSMNTATAPRGVTPFGDPSPASRLKRMAAAALLAFGLVVFFAQTGGHAAAEVKDALPYSTGYLLTGDYVVGGVDLDSRGAKGFQTGTINLDAAHGNTVPPNADVLAAFLYWETISPDVAPKAATGVKFRGVPDRKSVV